MATTPAQNPDPTVIVAGARTPFGKLLGSLKSQSGTDLGAVAIRGALDMVFSGF